MALMDLLPIVDGVKGKDLWNFLSLLLHEDLASLLHHLDGTTYNFD
jgi:hypothetical protein